MVNFVDSSVSKGSEETLNEETDIRGEMGHHKEKKEVTWDNPTNRTMYQWSVISSNKKGPITRSTAWTDSVHPVGRFAFYFLLCRITFNVLFPAPSNIYYNIVCCLLLIHVFGTSLSRYCPKSIFGSNHLTVLGSGNWTRLPCRNTFAG